MSVMDTYQQIIHASKYARWIDEKGRRETWDETVDRYIGFWTGRGFLNAAEEAELRHAIVNMDAMPSMRCMMTAGQALEKDEVAGYNCSYVAVDNVRVFDEVLYILMCGTGVGFSVERQFIAKLPEVAERIVKTDTVIAVSDSKIGWASALRQLISLLYSGLEPTWDVSRVRPAGSRLKTFGGRASGPEPLVDLFRFTVNLFRNATGRKLTSIECHDLICKIAEIVVVGGVRRSALISLSNLSDDRMRKAKNGQWWETEPQRQLANNSAVYTERPEFEVFMDEIRSLHESKAGERGIFSRMAAQKQAAKNGRRDPNHEFGCNPCSEILLRSAQFCNLSEVVVRSTDSLGSLKRKVRIATILGTLQSTLTNFRYLRKVWKDNCEDERLLGVSLTGIMDHAVLNGSNGPKLLTQFLNEMRQVAIDTNAEWAAKLGIKPATAITCVKPSGTVSQLVDSASGIHARFAPFYLRRIRSDKKDPLTNLLRDSGVYCEDDLFNKEAVVFSFPKRAPKGGLCVKDLNAIQQMELWEVYQDHWCEHKPSATIYYSDDEFLELMAWVWRKLDKISGVSFLPRSNHVYQQAPYEEISEAEYQGWVAQTPKTIDWLKLSEYEQDDNTTGSQELACTGGACEWNGSAAA